MVVISTRPPITPQPPAATRGFSERRSGRWLRTPQASVARMMVARLTKPSRPSVGLHGVCKIQITLTRQAMAARSCVRTGQSRKKETRRRQPDIRRVSVRARDACGGRA
jgi:hypothetical protein